MKCSKLLQNDSKGVVGSLRERESATRGERERDRERQDVREETRESPYKRHQTRSSSPTIEVLGQDKTRQGKVRQGKARHDMIR